MLPNYCKTPKKLIAAETLSANVAKNRTYKEAGKMLLLLAKGICALSITFECIKYTFQVEMPAVINFYHH